MAKNTIYLLLFLFVAGCSRTEEPAIREPAPPPPPPEKPKYVKTIDPNKITLVYTGRLATTRLEYIQSRLEHSATGEPYSSSWMMNSLSFWPVIDREAFFATNAFIYVVDTNDASYRIGIDLTIFGDETEEPEAGEPEE